MKRLAMQAASSSRCLSLILDPNQPNQADETYRRNCSGTSIAVAIPVAVAVAAVV